MKLSNRNKEALEDTTELASLTEQVKQARLLEKNFYREFPANCKKKFRTDYNKN